MNEHHPGQPQMIPIAPTVTTTTVTNTATTAMKPLPSGYVPTSLVKPQEIVVNPGQPVLQGSNVMAAPPLPLTAKPLNFNSRATNQSNSPAPLTIPPLSLSSASKRELQVLAPTGLNFRQPVIISQCEPIEIAGIPQENARNLQYVPVQINPAAGPVYDVNSNYAMETTQIGGVQTFMDQKVLELDMDSSTAPTPKIFTYTYGNMMGTGAPVGHHTTAY